MSIDTIWQLMMTETLNGLSLNDVVGGGNAEAIGMLSRSVVEQVGAVTPTAKILDIGCGCGRSAAAFASYLQPSASYVGVDLIPGLINFCLREITPCHPNFRFYTLRQHSEQYAAFIEQGIETDWEQGIETDWLESLSVLDSDFDLTIAFSLFTHLDAAMAALMLDKLWHRLRDGGYAVLTFFIMNPYSRVGIAEKKSNVFRGLDTKGDVIIDTFNGPNSAVGFDELALLNLILHSRFRRPHSIHYGSWSCGFGLHYQDVVVLRKEPSIPKDFDPEAYLVANPDVRDAGVNPYFHYHLYGRQEGRRFTQ
jgi:SAM-dependent methyltransferase